MNYPRRSHASSYSQDPPNLAPSVTHLKEPDCGLRECRSMQALPNREEIRASSPYYCEYPLSWRTSQAEVRSSRHTLLAVELMCGTMYPPQGNLETEIIVYDYTFHFVACDRRLRRNRSPGEVDSKSRAPKCRFFNRRARYRNGAEGRSCSGG